MNHDPIEDTPYFKSIIDAAEKDVMMSYIRSKMDALEDIVENGFTYDKEYEAFGIGRLWDIDPNTLERIIPEPSPEEKRQNEDNANTILIKMKEMLDEGKVKEVYKQHCIRGMGFCHSYWATKKSILKDKYGIDWKSPAEMNPQTCFD